MWRGESLGWQKTKMICCDQVQPKMIIDISLLHHNFVRDELSQHTKRKFNFWLGPTVSCLIWNPVIYCVCCTNPLQWLPLCSFNPASDWKIIFTLQAGQYEFLRDIFGGLHVYVQSSCFSERCTVDLVAVCVGFFYTLIHYHSIFFQVIF